MKKIIFLLALVFASSAIIAQTIDTPDVSITLNGATSTVTLKSVSSTRAINELCEQGINSKTNSVLVAGVWECDYDGAGYTPKHNGAALEGSPFKSKADAVKAMKLAMKAYYAANNTLAAR
jgi:hypothetical protein